MTALAFAVLVLVSYRVTRLVTTDSLWAGTRERITDALMGRGTTPASKLAELIGCPFCVGFWVSALTVATCCWVGWVSLPWRHAVVVAWAVAGAQALCSSIDARLNRED